MKKRKAIVLGVVVLIAAAIIAVLAFSLSGRAVSNQNSSSGSGALFSSSQFYPYSYQIFPGALSPEAQRAVTGFRLETQNDSDGSVTIKLIAINPEYQNQTYNVQPGQKLYFIERSLGDDSGGEERFPGDDAAIVVNSAGYIVQGPGSA